MYFGWVKLIIALGIGLAAAVAAVAQMMKHAGARKRMRAGHKEIADHTVVTLTGTVRLLGEPLIAPLSGTPCVLYRATARLLGATNRSVGLRTVDQVITKTEMIRFVLATRDGDVVVDGIEAEVPVRGTPIIPRKLAREQAFLDAQHAATAAQDAGFDELSIEPGMKISVHGIARVEISTGAGTGEAGFREAPPVVRLVGDDRHPLTIDHA